MLILPSTKISSENLVTSGGRKIKVMEALRRCRLRFFHNHDGAGAHTRDTGPSSGGAVPGNVDVEASAGDGQRVGASDTWCNVTVVGHGGEVRIDAAYYRVPAQAQLPEADQRWVMWLLGNGEVYEFLLQELRAVALESGLNLFVFNYRGVASSKGRVTCAGDLVSDTVMCLEYMEDTLAAAPSNVLIMGHSIGGAVGTVARACHSPFAPVVVERSFSSLPDAGWALLNMILGSTLDTTVALPRILVSGLLASIFKGGLHLRGVGRRERGEADRNRERGGGGKTETETEAGRDTHTHADTRARTRIDTHRKGEELELWHSMKCAASKLGFRLKERLLSGPAGVTHLSLTL